MTTIKQGSFRGTTIWITKHQMIYKCKYNPKMWIQLCAAHRNSQLHVKSHHTLQHNLSSTPLLNQQAQQTFLGNHESAFISRQTHNTIRQKESIISSDPYDSFHTLPRSRPKRAKANTIQFPQFVHKIFTFVASIHFWMTWMGDSLWYCNLDIEPKPEN